ncbi:MAG: hypothetical protein ACOH15_03255 [Acetobacterium sp.]
MLDKIKKEIEKKAKENGTTGSEDVSIVLNVTEAQVEKFLQDVDMENLDEHWNWDIIDDELRVKYKKEK